MENVLNRDTDAPVVPKEGQGNDKGGKDAITERVERLERELSESRESERYWAGIAKNGGGGRQAEAETDEGPDASEFLDEDDDSKEIDGDTPEKLVDEFAATGVKALAKRGFITAADAKKLAVEAALKVTQELIGRERVKMSSDQQLMSEFPELKDPKSDLYKATAKIYSEAVAMDPNAKKSPAVLLMAAKAAKLSLKPAPAPRDREDDDYEETESERRERARSQDSRPRGRGEVEDHDDMLGEEARQVIKGFGITEEEFKAARKETMRSAPRGRR